MEQQPQPNLDPALNSFQLGGQALVEGVMMRSPRYVAAAVRRADGSITTRLEPTQSVVQRYPWLGMPFVRGVVALFEMLGLGMRFLNWSSNLVLQDQKQQEQTATESAPDAMLTGINSTVNGSNGHTPDTVNRAAYVTATVDTAASATANHEPHEIWIPPLPVPIPSEHPLPGTEVSPPVTPDTVVPAAEAALPWWMFLLTIAASLGFGLLLFVALPNLLTDWTLRRATDNVIALNLCEGLIKLLIFIGYVGLIGLKPDIRRVFEYHGAEHKVVYAAENHCPITPAGARPFDTPHPRCGTGFALLTVVMSIVLFSFLPWTQSHLIRVAMRFALMPAVAGLSYEVIKLTASPRWSGLARIIMTPGLWLQRLTTRQPDDAQLEVSCAAMRAVLDAEAEATRSATAPRWADPIARAASI